MRGYQAFLKKEWMEAVRTYKVLLMFLIFLLLGIMNPLTAKLLPVLLENFMPEGMTISVQTPGAVDSWTQFYKNIPQMGYFVMVILFSGVMGGEFGKGTLLPLLAKGLRRDAVIYAKFTLAFLLWTMGYVVATVTSYGYTYYFWPKDKMENMAASLSMIWLFGLLLLAVLLLMGVLTKRVAGTLLGTGGVVVILLAVQLVPKLERYNPIALCSNNMAFLLGQQNPADYLPAVGITIGLILTSLVGACTIFRRESII